jgi:hypothetical protein
MLDIIAPHDDQLPLAVKVECIHHAKARLACPPSGRTHAPEEEGPHDQ